MNTTPRPAGLPATVTPSAALRASLASPLSGPSRLNAALRPVRLPLLTTAAALSVLACASVPPPTDVIAVSNSAVVQARNAGATELAPVEMRAAREKMDRANVLMNERNYEAARTVALEAEVDARLAEAKAQAAKAKQASDEVQQSLKVLREEMSRKN